MEIVLRIPTKPQYSFAEVRLTATDKADALAQLLEVDAELSEAIKDAVEHSTAIALLKGEGGVVVESSAKPWQKRPAAAKVDAQAAVKAAPPKASDFFS